MDLTDKIDLDKLSNDYGYQDDFYGNFNIGAKTVLRDITPKVAIDFARWLKESDFFESVDTPNLWKHWLEEDYTNAKSSEQLFQEFLKDYKYE